MRVSFILITAAGVRAYLPLVLKIQSRGKTQSNQLSKHPSTFFIKLILGGVMGYGMCGAASAQWDQGEKPVSGDCNAKLNRNEYRTGVRKDKWSNERLCSTLTALYVTRLSYYSL
jgi:hypothetical protein